MNAVCVYVSTAQLVFQTNPTDANTFSEQRLGDLCQLFSQLRQLLSCAVCTRLLNDPYAPLNDARCQHNVCRLCVRGRKCLRPLCGSCKDLQDFKTYAENRQMRCLLLCYKSLCEHLLGSSFFVQLSRQKQLMAVGSDHMSTQEIVLEGARYEDILNCFSADLPHAVTPRLQLPPASSMTSTAGTQSVPLSVSAATPLAPQAVPHMRAHMQNAPKAATPPSNAASATTTYVMATPTPATATIKQEHTSPSLPAAGAAHSAPVFAVSTAAATTATGTSKASAPAPLQPHVQSVYMKHVKHTVDNTSSHSFTTAGLAGLPATPTITYVGHNTPGIVVPLVSSSATTTAPLSIASAKLQSYNRQLAQARSSLAMQSGVVKTTALGADVHVPLTFKVASTACTAATTATSTTGTSSGNTHTTATVTSQQIRNPPSIKTVSNGSAMYSVLYTGVGNKITIKRKTDGDEDSSQRKNAGAPTSALPTSTTPTFRQQVPATTAAANAAKLNPKRRGCRCGNATPTPGKLTCCGQRCPCYVESKSCIGCKCRGCRNPHRPDGGKVRPVIPELACYEIQMADESASLSPSELPVATTATMRTSSPAQQSTTTVSAYSADPQPSSVVSQLNLTPTTSTASNTATLIPFINLQQVAQQQPQQLQQQPLESLQRESVLIQNAEGKYQVVNVFTTGSHSQHSAGMQRIHGISQLSANVTAASSSNHHNSGNTGHVTTVNMLSVSTAAPVTTTATSTNTLPQILLQQQQHHQRQHQQQQLQKQQTQLHHLQRIASGSSSTTTSISLQLQQQQQQHHQRQLQQQQQQFKTHNIMTMRAPSSSNTQTQTMPLLAASGATSTTITLSPIIVTSPNTFTPDMFSDSESDDFLHHAHMLPISSAPTRIVAVPPAQASPLSLSSGSGNSSSGSGSTAGGGDMSISMGGAHLAPAMVEVIEASDV